METYLNLAYFEAKVGGGDNFTYSLKDGIYVSADGKSDIGGLFDLVLEDNRLAVKSKISQEVGNDIVVVYNVSQGTDAQQVVNSDVREQRASSTVGGIDFDPSLLNLQIKRNGKGVPLPLPQQNLESINIEGLYPVIINMQPATIQNFPFLLSAEKEQKVPELSMRPTS